MSGVLAIAGRAVDRLDHLLRTVSLISFFSIYPIGWWLAISPLLGRGPSLALPLIVFLFAYGIPFAVGSQLEIRYPTEPTTLVWVVAVWGAVPLAMIVARDCWPNRRRVGTSEGDVHTGPSRRPGVARLDRKLRRRMLLFFALTYALAYLTYVGGLLIAAQRRIMGGER